MWKLVKDKQKALVVVTHNQDLARQADRIVELFDGRVKL
jgi:ABC-type lipoprotein export system ATPase subunit